ncbi:ribosome small subunit-dependent GTPase A [uncultured Thiothrix sp.]|uniref:ribosome small subunit-dependent GTPase A n=1 Tax=uncultured Thiothrix sp. TaxID=223185 RepID=UPI002606B4E8|nr:ribosome small subunit-dependent GTPase A [uncultured Thiothrix sp.]
MQNTSLLNLGWRPFFQQQLSLSDLETYTPARVIAQHRSEYGLMSEQGEIHLSILHSMPALTVGDWLLLDNQQHFVRELERFSLFSRKAAGHKNELQLIAANVDTVFMVSSLNENFNLNRLERYLALAHEAQVEPVVVLTKADLCANPEDYVQQVQKLDRLLVVEAVNGLDNSTAERLQAWCGAGQTIALLGSSGVGKSTLVNTLLGQAQQLTQATSELKHKGRHTTTSRSLHAMPRGALLLDTPGMRELQLSACEDGVEATFAEISELAQSCRFADCQHVNEPNCAVQAALKSGDLDLRRLQSYRKLQREQAHNSATLAEKHAFFQKQGRLHKAIQEEQRKYKKGY